MTATRRATARAMPSGLVRRERAASKCRRGSHQRHLALDGRAVHVAPVLLVVERRGAMLCAAVVPQYGVAGTPAVPIHEFGPHGKFLQRANELGAFGLGHAFHFARPAADIERGPAGLWMAPRHRMPHVGTLALVFFGQCGEMRVVHLVQAHYPHLPAIDRKKKTARPATPGAHKSSPNDLQYLERSSPLE